MSTKNEDYFRILLITQPLKRINLREISNKEYLEDIFSISHKRSLMALLYFMRLLPELRLQHLRGAVPILNSPITLIPPKLYFRNYEMFI